MGILLANVSLLDAKQCFTMPRPGKSICCVPREANKTVSGEAEHFFAKFNGLKRDGNIHAA